MHFEKKSNLLTLFYLFRRDRKNIEIWLAKVNICTVLENEYI